MRSIVLIFHVLNFSSDVHSLVEDIYIVYVINCLILFFVSAKLEIYMLITRVLLSFIFPTLSFSFRSFIAL